MPNHNKIENILSDQNKRPESTYKPVKDSSFVPEDTEINIPIHDPDENTPSEPQKTSIPIGKPVKDSSFVPEDTEINIPIHDPDENTPSEPQKTSIPIRKPVKDSSFVPEDTEINIPTPMWSISQSPILWASLIVFLSVFLLIILSELLQFFQSVQAAPFFLQIPAYICIFTLLAALSWSFIKLVIAYKQLRKSPQVRLDQIRDGLNRKIIREQIDKKISKGFETLQMIVKEYPIRDKKQIDLLKKSGMTSGKIDTFKSNINFLLGKNFVGKEKWIEDCDRLFVQVIDDCAKSLVKTYSLQVALKTAIIPYGFLDAFTVAVNSVYMVEDLCRLYFVRGGKWQSFILAMKVLFSVFIAAKIEDKIDTATQGFTDSLLESCQASFGELFSKGAAVVLKRTAEVEINGFFFYRIGIATISMLRPIRIK
jgi:hypothetical protein